METWPPSILSKTQRRNLFRGWIQLGFPNSFTSSNVDIVIDDEFKVETWLPSILGKTQRRNLFRGWIRLRN